MLNVLKTRNIILFTGVLFLIVQVGFYKTYFHYFPALKINMAASVIP